MDQTQTGKKFYQKKRYWILGAFLLLLIIAVGGSEPSTQTSEEAAPAYSFDVPSLIGKDMEELEAELGTPTTYTPPTEAQLASGIQEWEKDWKKGEHHLMATYNVQTGEVIDLFIGADTDAAFESFSDTDNILKAGNLTENDPRYSVEFVKALRGGGYTGAIVRAK